MLILIKHDNTHRQLAKLDTRMNMTFINNRYQNRVSIIINSKFYKAKLIRRSYNQPDVFYFSFIFS